MISTINSNLLKCYYVKNILLIKVILEYQKVKQYAIIIIRRGREV